MNYGKQYENWQKSFYGMFRSAYNDTCMTITSAQNTKMTFTITHKANIKMRFKELLDR